MWNDFRESVGTQWLSVLGDLARPESVVGHAVEGSIDCRIRGVFLFFLIILIIFKCIHLTLNNNMAFLHTILIQKLNMP